VCTWDRQPVEAVQRLLSTTPIPVDTITSIQIGVHPAAARDGLWLKTDPRTHLETQMSHPYALAMAILGVPGPAWQKPETFTRADARELMGKMTVVVEPEAERAYYDQLSEGIRRVRRSPASVTIVADGRTYRESADYAKGDPYTEGTRLTDDELIDKFVSYGLDTADKDELEIAARAILAMDEYDDVRDVARLMSYPQKLAKKIPSRIKE
jgi:2-methylcitrate dehydratase PrpD